MRKYILLLVTLLLVTLTISACSMENNADKGARDTAPADIINFPNDFRNVAHKCDGKGHRVYVTNYNETGTSSSVAVIDDPSCVR